MIYFTGDCHGDTVEKFSFKQHPWLKDVTADDFVFIAGDFGAIWDWHGFSKNDKYKLEKLNEKPWTTIVVLGNHENWDAYEEMPVVDEFGGKVKQCVYGGVTYDHIFIVAEPTVLDVDGKHILCIPGADSHDIWNLLDPSAEDFKEKKKEMHKAHMWYRVIGQSWWPQEEINIDKATKVVAAHVDEHFDFVVTHDAPGLIKTWHGGGWSPTLGESFLNQVAKVVDFDKWIHGHFHFDYTWPGDSRFVGLYHCFYLGGWGFVD